MNIALNDSIHPLNLRKLLHVGIGTLFVGLKGIQCLVWLTL